MIVLERARYGAAALALTLLGTTGARAEPNETAKQLARELMTRGRAARDAGDQNGALASFSHAHAIMHVPTTLLEAVRARVALGQWLEALALAKELESMPSAADDPPPFARARSEAVELVHELELRMPTLQLDLAGSPEPETTTVLIDGVARPDCTQACWLNPGKHSLLVSSRSSQAEEELDAVAGAVMKLALVFSPRPQELPDARRMRAVAQEQPAALPPRAASQPLPTAVWVLGGVAAAGVAGGVVLGLSAVSERDSLQESCAPSCGSDQVDGVRRRALAANVSFGVGAAAAAGALAAYLFQSPAPAARASAPGSGRSKRLQVWGAPTPAGAYLAVDATF